MNERLLKQYIREILRENAADFIKAVNRAELYADDVSRTPSDEKNLKSSLNLKAQDIKRIFRDTADHAWLKRLDTVHWNFDGAPWELKRLKGRNRDEISCTMALPGKEFFLPTHGEESYGLWVKGRITLAAYDQDMIWSGFLSRYMSRRRSPEQRHRRKSSGVNKLPATLPWKGRWTRLEQELENVSGFSAQELDYEFPYVLDQETWVEPAGAFMNEALVDNWRPVGIVVPEFISQTMQELKKSKPELRDVAIADYITEYNAGSEYSTKLQWLLECIEVAQHFDDLPIFNFKKEKIWEPQN